jgi:hypothetical protein
MDEWEAMRVSWARVRNDWHRGRRDGYPRCCIAMFCWDSLWSLPPSLTRVVAQGVETPDSTCDWVPCGVFHHGGSSLSLPARIGRLSRYWWYVLVAIRGGGLPGHGSPRAPWRPADPPCPPAPTSQGPMEAAWAELDAQLHDPDLDWI